MVSYFYQGYILGKRRWCRCCCSLKIVILLLCQVFTLVVRLVVHLVVFLVVFFLVVVVVVGFSQTSVLSVVVCWYLLYPYLFHELYLL